MIVCREQAVGRYLMPLFDTAPHNRLMNSDLVLRCVIAGCVWVGLCEHHLACKIFLMRIQNRARRIISFSLGPRLMVCVSVAMPDDWVIHWLARIEWSLPRNFDQWARGLEWCEGPTNRKHFTKIRFHRIGCESRHWSPSEPMTAAEPGNAGTARHIHLT